MTEPTQQQEWAVSDLRIVVRSQISTTLKRPGNGHSCDFPIRHARTP